MRDSLTRLTWSATHSSTLHVSTFMIKVTTNIDWQSHLPTMGHDNRHPLRLPPFLRLRRREE